MDQREDNQERSPAQDHLRRQGRVQHQAAPPAQQPQQWPPQRQIFPTGQQPQQQQPQQQPQQQQPQYPVQRRPYSQQEMPPSNPTIGVMPQDLYVQQQQQLQQSLPMNYQIHPQAAVAGPYVGYPAQHYPPQPANSYHPSQVAAMQQSQYMQQAQRMGIPPMMDHPLPVPHQPYVQPTVGRLPSDRPLVKLSVSLIDTYKHINKVYYEEREARRAARAAQKVQKGSGLNNNGWDDENYDYIVNSGEMFFGRYVIKERIGKGSFGQVVRAVDTESNKDVAIKIIKSKKPFLMQAKTEIELLTQLCDKDSEDQNNIETHFMYRNHQCLVFEMLSLNLYELLKNTQFGGVSLNLIRKFAKQILKALSFLARSDVDIIHCDLKPENILLRHPKRSGIKVIDFGSSCKSNKRMYSYIQSRFYRSPEVMLGLPYGVAIDMWSLGCILAEMHTGEPLFSGSDQFDQMQKIVKLLGMVPTSMLDQSGDQQRLQFFEKYRTASGGEEWAVKQQASSSSKSPKAAQRIVPSENPIETLTEVICAETTKKKRYPPSETGNSQRNYEMFIDLIHRMLAYSPEDRIKPEEALNHPFIRSGEQSQSTSPYPQEAALPTASGQRKAGPQNQQD